MKNICESCGKPISEIGRISKFSVLLARKRTKFGNDTIMFKELWLCKRCIEEKKTKNKIIFEKG